MSKKFIQDAEFIEVVSRADGPRTQLTPDEIIEARRRIAEGEDEDFVIAEVMEQKLKLS